MWFSRFARNHATTQQRRAGSGFPVARENRLVHFSCPPARPDDRPISCRGSHLFLKTNTCISRVFQIRGMKRAGHRGGWQERTACAFASPCVPPRARPLPLLRQAPLRVISFARTRPRRSRLPHRQTPARVRICVAGRAPRARAPSRCSAPPPAAARGPAEGYFTRASPSTEVPGAYPSQSGAPGLALSRLSAASPGRAFAPLSATGLGFGKAGAAPEACSHLN